MCAKSNKMLQNEAKRLLRRQFRKLGGLGVLVLLLVLFLIGFLRPEWQKPVADLLGVPAAEDTGLSAKDNEPLDSKKKSPLREGTWEVVHVADGDTLDVLDDQGVKHRIRFIGADTPEVVKPNTPIQPFGPEASAFTKRMVAESGNRVRVAFDGDQIDKYDRNLAMIYVRRPEGEVCLNELLLREGLARARLQYRFSKGAKFRMEQAENEARAARRGIWSLDDTENAPEF